MKFARQYDAEAKKTLAWVKTYAETNPKLVKKAAKLQDTTPVEVVVPEATPVPETKPEQVVVKTTVLDEQLVLPFNEIAKKLLTAKLGV